MKTKPLLLLHGALGAADQMSSLEFALSQLVFDSKPVLKSNFPGHGGLPIPDEPFSISMFSNFIFSFLNAEKIEKVNFFGYSMGGYVALDFAQKHPERVGKIATLGTKFDWTPDSAARETAMLDPEKIALKVPKFAEALAKRHGENWKTVVQKTAEMLMGLGNGAALKKEDFQKITCPILLIRGDADNMVSEKETAETASFLPNGRFINLAESKHPIEQVNLENLTDQLLAFY